MTPCFRSILATAWLLGGSLAGCATSPSGTGADVDAVAVSARVKAALVEDAQVQARDVQVETRHGVVELNGFVDSQAAKDRAETVARAISGVAEVHNNLVVPDAQRSVAQVVDDATITAKVRTALIGSAYTEGANIDVTTRQGVVELSGVVEDSEARSAAERLASNINGVRGVHNQLELEQTNQ